MNLLMFLDKHLSVFDGLSPQPKNEVVKLLRVHGGCLGVKRRWRTWLAAISPGQVQTTVNPGISEWGNPLSLGNQMVVRMAECIGHDERTMGTETSQYHQERKSIETPLVAASESGHSPNREACFSGLRKQRGVTKVLPNKSVWKGIP